MMSSSRLHDTGDSFPNRRGHGSQLSISDPSHHVTEAIGTLYGDNDDDGHDTRRDSRPLSFVASPHGGEQLHKPLLYEIPHRLPTLEGTNVTVEHRMTSRVTADTKPTIDIPTSNGHNGGPEKSQTLPTGKHSETSGSPLEPLLPTMQPSSPLSPTHPLRDVQNDSQSGSRFPLTNIDNPNDIAQELSNLQALRRMSMDVGNSADPDLVPFQGLSLMAMPSIAPSGEDDEGDISRLLWVPAKVHPELAPDQFKSFLEKRVQSIKRRSGDSQLATDGQQPRADGGGLGRNKSMLSRQVESKSTETNWGGAGNDHNGAGDWRPRRKTSETSTIQSGPELNLNDLLNDSTKIVQRLALDSQRQTGSLDMSSLDDKPILPVATMGLRRSTRTTYRKGGSLRSGDRVPLSRRSAGARQPRRNTDSDEGRSASHAPVSEPVPPAGLDLQHASSEPSAPENFSHPVRPVMRQHQLVSQDGDGSVEGISDQPPATRNTPKKTSTTTLPEFDTTPQMLPTEFVAEGGPIESHESQPAPQVLPTAYDAKVFPYRSSSQSSLNHGPAQPSIMFDAPQSQSDNGLQQEQNRPQQSRQHPPPKSIKGPSFGRSSYQSSDTSSSSGPDTTAGQALNGMVNLSFAVPGHSSSRTDGLSVIPTLPVDDRKADKKLRDKEETEGGKSTGWKWFKSDERERKKKGKDKERDREKEDQAKKMRSKADRPQSEKTHDGARLDVLQSSIDNSGTKERESLLLDRDGLGGKSHEDKVDSGIRKATETKKEKDGFFGSIFGGSRRKESKDGGSNKGKQRVTSPDPVLRLLRPDIDYPYTRFPIVEERAIYRMAHIKLANPRRDLRSQVLLSNFMYSYLAKVQAMHPQLNVPTSPHQKRQEERKRQGQELQQQQYMEQHISMQQGHHSQDSGDQYVFEYSTSSSQYGDTGQRIGDDRSLNYVDDAQIFEYDHDGPQSGNSIAGIPPQEHLQQQPHRRHQDGGGQDYERHSVNRKVRGYYDYGHADDGHHSESDMWG
ncbi:telomere silencing protein [Sporothrix schenckii 1099-18]|uniref:Telomere silencing protein n=1 Tax=Sporothrix schenckii 1099-18 TaxID=1397361 RepID=A0A0F2LUN5_SPOSC|nr:telomere silencing protein [Sporothrix schenckii 1099-18]KJR81177.1 telomere silencing protein [Sporothrix schenckii 1099-18]